MNTMDEWIALARQELGIDLELDKFEILDMTKVVAHNVTRPLAPVAAFLVGYAAAQSGGGAAAVTETCARATALAEQWAADHPKKDDDD